MKKVNLGVAAAIVTMVIFMSSCRAVGDIFKAGVWFGVIGIIIVVLIIFWLIGKAGKK